MYLHRNQQGFVYIAYNKAMKKIVKIGATNSDPAKRLKVLSNQSVPFPFELLASYETCDCLGFEQYCHQNLMRRHVAKEFFKVDKQEAIHLIDILASTFQKKATRVQL